MFVELASIQELRSVCMNSNRNYLFNDLTA